MSTPRPEIPLVCRACGFTTPGTPGLICPYDGRALLADAVFAAHRADPHLGRVVASDLGLIEPLGGGAFGTVYRAVQYSLNRHVAVKVMGPQHAHVPEMRARFLREARIVARLADPSTVKVFAFGEEPQDGLLYMVMELIEGLSFRQVLRQEARLAPERVVRLGEQMLGALAEAHGLGLVHRDLKPENLMRVRGTLDEERIKILDFGMAKILDPRNDEDGARLTGTRALVGTPTYLSPEQADSLEVGPPSDLYSIGVVLYEMLSGAPPFRGRTALATVRAHVELPVPPMPPAMGVPAPLEAVVRRALAKRPQDRFADARTMAAALRTALSREPVTSSEWALTVPFEPKRPPSLPPRDVSFDPKRTSLGPRDVTPEGPTSWGAAPLSWDGPSAPGMGGTFPRRVPKAPRRRWIGVVVALAVLGGGAAWLWFSTLQDRDEPAAEQPPIPRPASVATRVERPAPPTVAPAPATMAAAPVSVAAAPPSQAPPSQAAPRPPRPAEPRAAEPQPWESALNRALQNARDGDDAGAVLNLQRALQQAPEPQEALRRAREAVPLQDAARRSPRVASMLGITVKPAPEDAPSTP